jgi:hypothetical protein
MKIPLYLIYLVLIMLCPKSFAQLKSLDDNHLSLITGQSFISISETLQNTSQKHTRINLGLDIDVMASIDQLELGRYNRPGSSLEADIMISHLSLGKIDSSGAIRAFKIRDPFVEIATEKDAEGIDKFIGLRVGASRLKGDSIANLIGISGNVPISIKDNTIGVFSTALTPIFGGILGGIFGAIGGFSAFGITSTTEINANLTDANGNLLQIRSNTLGVDNRDWITITNPRSYANPFLPAFLAIGVLGFLGGIQCSDFLCLALKFEVRNCTLFLVANVCKPTIINTSLEIGQQHAQSLGGTGNREWVNDAYLSIQSQDITWHDQAGPSTTPSGYSVNIPAGAINVNADVGLNGSARGRYKYIDPYFGQRNTP